MGQRQKCYISCVMNYNTLLSYAAQGENPCGDCLGAVVKEKIMKKAREKEEYIAAQKPTETEEAGQLERSAINLIFPSRWLPA